MQRLGYDLSLDLSSESCACPSRRHGTTISPRTLFRIPHTVELVCLARSCGLPRGTQRLPSRTSFCQTTSHPSKPCRHPRACTLFYGYLTKLRASAEGNFRPIEYVAFSFHFPVRRARDACARIFQSPTLMVPWCKPVKVHIPLPFHFSPDGFSRNTPSAPNHTKLM